MQNSEAEVITISLNEYNDLLKCKEVIEEIADAVRNSENKIGPKICQSDSAPTSEASIIEKIEWLKLYINACRKTLLDFYSVKKKLFEGSSKKVDKKNTSKEKNLDDNKPIDVKKNTDCTENSELTKLYNEYKKNGEKLKEYHKILEDFDENNKDAYSKREEIVFLLKNLQERKKHLEKQIKLFSKLYNKDSTEKRDDSQSDNTSNNDEDNFKKDDVQSDEINYDEIINILEEIFSLSSYDYDNEFRKLLKDIIEEIELIDKYTRESEKKAEEKKKEFHYLNKISEKFFSKVTEIYFVEPNIDDLDVYKYFYNKDKLYQINKKRVISSHIYRWDIHQKINCFVKKMCADDNVQFEINPSATFNLSAFDKDNNLICNLNTFRVLNDNPSEHDLKLELNKRYHFPKELLDIMTVVKGKISGEYILVLSPTEFAGIVQFIFGAVPSFVGKHISLYSLTLMISEILSLFTTKSKLSAFYKMQHGECVPNRQQFILNFNGFGRCLKGLEVLQRKILLKNSKSLLVDETFIKCLEFVNILNVVFSLASGKHDKLRGVSYGAANTRSSEEFLNLLLKDDLSLIENVETLVTDCCPIYFSPEVKNILINIKNATCHAHARRRILEDLGKLKLDKIFIRLSKLSICNFILNLRKEINDKKIKLGSIGSKLFFAAFILNIIFRLEKDFPYQNKDVMKDRRQKYSKPILNIYFRILEDLALSFNGVTHKRNDSDDTWQGTGINIGEYSSLYILNHKKLFSEFLNNGDTEITNNLSEFLLRSIARYRNSMEFFATKDGINSFLVLDSLAMTSTMNHLNNFFYILWAFVNWKIQLEYSRLENIKNNQDQDQELKQICLLPNKESKLNKDGEKEKISMYDQDKKMKCDMVNFEGIDVWSCVEILRREKLRIKSEFLE